jgi:hypothetical protein
LTAALGFDGPPGRELAEFVDQHLRMLAQP